MAFGKRIVIIPGKLSLTKKKLFTGMELEDSGRGFATLVWHLHLRDDPKQLVCDRQVAISALSDDSFVVWRHEDLFPS